MKESLFVFSVVFILAFSACEKESIKTDYEISVNELLDVSFESNPSTGYGWFWSNREKSSVVDSVDCVFHPRYPDMMGSPGIEIWTFKGIARGTDTLKFQYRFPGRDSIISEEVFTIRVK